MKSYKQFLTEAKETQYLITVKIDGKTAKQQEMGYKAAKALFDKAVATDKSVASGGVDIDKMFDKVDNGKPQGIKIENREMNIQLKD